MDTVPATLLALTSDRQSPGLARLPLLGSDRVDPADPGRTGGQVRFRAALRDRP